MVDFTDEYDDEVLALPAEGKYLAEVKRAEQKHSKNNDLMFILEFKEVPSGRTLVTDFLSFGKAGYGMAKSKLQSLGVIAHNIKGFSVVPAECVGKRAFIYIKHEVYKEKETAKIDISKGIVGFEPEYGTPASDDEIDMPASNKTPFD